MLALTALTFFRVPEALLLLRLQDAGVAVAVVPLVWAGLHVVRSASSYPGGWLSDRLGPRATVAAGGLVFAAVVATLGASAPAVRSRWSPSWRSASWPDSRSRRSGRWWRAWRRYGPDAGSACIMR